MVLKEAFRYQNYLNNLFCAAETSLLELDHCLKTTKIHYKNKANPDIAEPEIEEVAVREFFSNDDVLAFIDWLVDERLRLATAITRAKEYVSGEQGFDIDAAVECNKYRQNAAGMIETMLNRKGSVRKEKGTDYRFNAEGTQAPYYYEIEVKSEEAFDRKAAKSVQKRLSGTADAISMKIDTALVTTEVDYIPPYDVTDSFDEVMADFIKKHMKK